MSSTSRPRHNFLGRDVSGKVPEATKVPGLIKLGERDEAIWKQAKQYLRVRDNDAHSLYSYAIAKALVLSVDRAQEHIVLPAILLHDTGWSTVNERDALDAIAPGADESLKHLIVKHEVEGARIAHEILSGLGTASQDIEEITKIINGHDTRTEAISINDMVVKDADKLWRVTPHAREVVMDWFGLDADQALRLCAYRAHDDLFTEVARTMSSVLVAVGSMQISDEMANVYAREDVHK